MPYIRFLIFLFRHKYYVFRECFKYGLYWRGLTHDLSKLFPWEMNPYVRACFLEGNNIAYGLSKTGFMDISFEDNMEYFRAVAHHKRTNRHHPEHWLFIDKDAKIFAIPMDEDSIFEMICDWRGAGMVRGTKYSYLRWYWLNRDKILLHDTTRAIVEGVLQDDFMQCVQEAKCGNKHAFQVASELRYTLGVDF